MEMLFVSLLSTLMWFIHDVSGECQTGRFYLGSVNESHPDLLPSTGVYTLQPGLVHESRPVYRHQSGAFYMHRPRGGSLRQPVLAECLWVVSADVTASLGDAPLCLTPALGDPTSSSKQTWHAKIGGVWKGLPELKATCVEKDFAVCSSGTLEVSGIAKASSRQAKFEGTYILQPFTSQLRPVYKKAEGPGYLLYEGMWLIKSRLNTRGISLFVSDYAFRPELVTNSWWVFSGRHLRLAPIKITCVGQDIGSKVAAFNVTTSGCSQASGSSALASPAEGTPQNSGSAGPSGTSDTSPTNGVTVGDPEHVVATATTFAPVAKSSHGQSDQTTQTVSLKPTAETSLIGSAHTEKSDMFMSTVSQTTTSEDLSVDQVLGGADVRKPEGSVRACACLNGGKSVSVNFGGKRQVICRCQSGYFGTRCQREILCDEAPLVAGATLLSQTGTEVFSLAFYTCSSGRRCTAVCSPGGRWETYPECVRLYDPLLWGSTSVLHNGR